MTQTDELIKKLSQNPTWEEGFHREQKKLEAAMMITQLRTTAGISQKKLADKAGIAKSTIARIENGNMSPTVKTMEKIANAAGKKLEMRFA